MKSYLKLSVLVLLCVLLFHLSCKKEFSCEDCAEKNKPPIAVAGPNQVIALPTDSVLLDGSASSDPDGKVSRYLWTKISGPASSNIFKLTDSITKVKALTVGIYQFELKVTDNGGLSANDTVQIIVDDPAVNQPPIANAGTDQIISLPTDTVLLDGSASFDPDGTIASYKWTKIAGAASSTILKPDSAKTVVNTLTTGVYQFELRVTDNGGLSVKDTIRITVDSVLITNHPPIANAGANQSVTLPNNTATVDGSGSSDPDNNIISYLWTKVSGPSSFTIANANAIQTQITNLTEGTYQFELRVTDVGSLFSRDTIQIIVQPIVQTNCDTSNRLVRNASFTLVTQLPEQRYRITIASAGTKIFFAGGHTSFSSTQPVNFSGRVDIYDVTTSQWTVTQLSIPRIIDAVAVMGNKIFFAGGWNTSGYKSAVDIYDITTDTWSAGQLTLARGGMIAGSISNKVLFAGGANIPNLYSIVDVYSTATNSWSTASLSAAKYNPNNFAYSTPNPPVVGQKIFFISGQYCWIQDCPSNRIDIYDAATNTWSYEDYTPRPPGDYLFSGIAAGNKNYWVTGDYWEGGNLVEIRDELTHTTSYGCLSGFLFGHPVKNNNKLIFPVSASPMSTLNYKLTHFDIYDLATNTWSISKLSAPFIYHQLISVNNEVYEIGGYFTPNGYLEDKIYKVNY